MLLICIYICNIIYYIYTVYYDFFVETCLDPTPEQKKNQETANNKQKHILSGQNRHSSSSIVSYCCLWLLVFITCSLPGKVAPPPTRVPIHGTCCQDQIYHEVSNMNKYDKSKISCGPILCRPTHFPSIVASRGNSSKRTSKPALIASCLTFGSFGFLSKPAKIIENYSWKRIDMMFHPDFWGVYMGILPF